jgi:hypothetical protein
MLLRLLSVLFVVHGPTLLLAPYLPAKVTGTVTRKLRLALWLPLAPVSMALVIPTEHTPTLLCGGSGTGATANITVAGGAVTAATLVRGGQFYIVGNSLSCLLIGAGTNFALPVATVTQG